MTNSPTSTSHFPKACFAEDEQTAYGDCWTGAKVVFTGHSGIDEITGIGRDYARGPNAWGPYEHTPRDTWGPGQGTSEGYRHTASYGWVAQALALHLLHAEKAWDHDPFFDYVDRWMYKEIPRRATGVGRTSSTKCGRRTAPPPVCRRPTAGKSSTTIPIIKTPSPKNARVPRPGRRIKSPAADCGHRGRFRATGLDRGPA